MMTTAESEITEKEINDDDIDEYLDALDDFDTSPAAARTETAAEEMPSKFSKVIEESFDKINSNKDGVKDSVDFDGMEQMMKELEGLMQSGDFDEVFGVHHSF